ncbi:TetR/AcrR family transcriptional regulator [Beijerinckia mobilis]|uniref:TetR/AcrR family transcriptional regulator n=1 Tax=Beijerinckia mobilis TaxID=231434 RepID=UPI000554CF6A|nr:TetR/AcrR family transcriptional regulator [Beijerinckia mobilis]
MGRPREFDLDQALDRALALFWRNGYEGTTLADITEALGVTKPSLYAAFGNKEDLFRKALDRFYQTHLHFIDTALAKPHALEVAQAMLDGYILVMTGQQTPAGCLNINGALVCSNASESIQKELTTRRAADEEKLCERLTRAKEEGDLPASSDPAELARFIMTMACGLSVQAKAGASREALQQVAATALHAWPQ